MNNIIEEIEYLIIRFEFGTIHQARYFLILRSWTNLFRGYQKEQGSRFA